MFVASIPMWPAVFRAPNHIADEVERHAPLTSQTAGWREPDRENSKSTRRNKMTVPTGW